ncbi:MAG: MarR family transcriptional regulator [Proteobacteria bacterium]|nr:MarR family transcriptional regulator [Pseudomonadota bacterium]MBU1388836.1 MarR family transcriptional regulator [Pseudomonadota bacterium]MBU1542217.1 MarR family transcriptional regulator [Pseudomonadota bacterium]MBU2430303.1 MarR family transcriptional regulator [Pseudomonadota bacterium]MBU2480407.1 MarR family transcriptional regulator [Pseudomonadota bacterium]
MKEMPEDLPDCTVFLLGKAYQKAHGEFKNRLKPYDLTNMQHLVLEGLWYKDGITATELGKTLILDKATLSGVLDRMVEGGWIVKTQDPEDKRVSRLFPSDKANRMKTELIEVRKQANEDLLAEFRPEERILLNRFLWDLI